LAWLFRSPVLALYSLKPVVMKLLLAAFLLVIFSLQASHVAVGESVAASVSLEHGQACAADADAEALKVSSALEELSDYLPAVFPVLPAAFAAPRSHPAAFIIVSADLPTTRPPPRG
jgi:hypothetical protein